MRLCLMAVLVLLSAVGCDNGDGGGSIPKYKISGTITGDKVEGVTITLSGAGSRTTTTDAGGNYEITGLVEGDYVVTPSAYGHDFTAQQRTITSLGADVMDADFVSTINPARLPYAGEGTRLGIIYPDAAPAAATALDASFGELIAAGLDTYELAIPWKDIETSAGSGTTSGTIDTTRLESLLLTIQNAGLKPMIVIVTIDSVVPLSNSLPSDLVDPTDNTILAAGRAIDDPVILTRFKKVLEVAVPLIKARGGYCISVANEVDGYYDTHPGSGAAIANFVGQCRDYVHTLDSGMAVSGTLTYGALADPSAAALIIDECDVVQITYYPLQSNFTPRDPSVVSGELDAIIAAAGSKQIVLQEIGYPSGYLPTPGNGSSELKQAQFYANVFEALATRPQIRAVSALQLSDWSPAAIDTYVTNYGISDAAFREYLASLGVRKHADGAPKTAYATFLSELVSFREP